MTDEQNEEPPTEAPAAEKNKEASHEPAEQKETPAEEQKEEAPVEEAEAPKEVEVEDLLNEATEKKEVEVDDLLKEASAPEEEAPAEEPAPPEEKPEQTTHIYALRTTANREDQVLSFVSSNAARKKLPVHTVISPHGMRGYIFVEADDPISAEQAAQGVPYAKGILPAEINYTEIEHMLEQVKKEIKIQKNDIVEIISGPFKRENAKITRVDKAKEEVVVELLEAAVPIPITLNIDAVKVIRREEE
ncbi:MAG: transcription elongation factor Spt5 [Candidatus Woesearchaeota archaeon]|nr:transcription elongation factor Spt5 [Candidatus Woesearchaeota archaeon]